MKHKVHYFKNLNYPLRGLCGRKAAEVIMTRDLRMVTCTECRAIRKAEIAKGRKTR